MDEPPSQPAEPSKPKPDPLSIPMNDIHAWACEEAYENERKDEAIAFCIKAMDQGEAIVNGVDGDGDTMLHIAMHLESGALVEELMRRGCTMLDKANNSGYTPLHVGALNCKYAESHSAIEAVIKHGPNVNAKAAQDSGKTALHAAAKEKVMEVVDMLLAAGADCRIKDDYGDTAGEEPFTTDEIKAKLAARAAEQDAE